MIVMHIADVPVEAVFTLYLVWAHRTGELRLDPALVTLVLDKGTSARVTATAPRTDIRLVLDQCGDAWLTRRTAAVAC